MVPVHGGEVQQAAKRAGLRRQAFLDASASLVPWCPSWQRIGLSAWRDYPDRSQVLLRERIGVLHGVEPSFVCLLYTSPSPRDRQKSRMPSSA